MSSSRNRVIYAGNTVLISNYPAWDNQTGDYNLKLLNRIQSSAISIDTPVTRPKQIGSSQFAFEKYINYPTVKVDLEYYLTDNSNELLLGFNASGSEGILKNLATSEKDRNLFFVFSEEENVDVNSLTNYTGLDVFGVGNAFITDYSISASVNSIPSAKVSFDALNIVYQKYTGFSVGEGISGPIVTNGTPIPAINLTNGIKATGSYLLAPNNFDTSKYLTYQSVKPKALSPAEIILNLEQPVLGGVRYSGSVSANITDLQITIPIERKDLVGFGSNYPYGKKLIFPILGSVSFNGIFDNQVTGELNNLFNENNGYDMSFLLKDCDFATKLKFEIFDARIDSQSFSMSIGENMAFSSTFNFKIFEQDGFRISGASRLKKSLSVEQGNDIPVDEE